MLSLQETRSIHDSMKLQLNKYIKIQTIYEHNTLHLKGILPLEMCHVETNWNFKNME